MKVSFLYQLLGLQKPWQISPDSESSYILSAGDEGGREHIHASSSSSLRLMLTTVAATAIIATKTWTYR